jgi:hypothetical protein
MHIDQRYGEEATTIRLWCCDTAVTDDAGEAGGRGVSNDRQGKHSTQLLPKLVTRCRSSRSSYPFGSCAAVASFRAVCSKMEMWN